MKTLQNYIKQTINEEVAAGFSTPSNTAGMGNPMASGENAAEIAANAAEFHGEECGSGDVPKAGGEPPMIDELPDGEYDGIHYAWIFELPDGRLFKTHSGIKCGRKAAVKAHVSVKGHKAEMKIDK